MEISVTLTNTPKQKPADESSLGFGKFFSDHMFIMEYEEGKGWMNPRIEPYHRLSLDPTHLFKRHQRADWLCTNIL